MPLPSTNVEEDAEMYQSNFQTNLDAATNRATKSNTSVPII